MARGGGVAGTVGVLGLHMGSPEWIMRVFGDNPL